MDVYLMQHGVAATEEVDPARPLTDAGRMAVEEVAARARSLGVRAGVCVHSGKLRARQTAAILAAALGAALEERPDLGPSDPVGPAAEWLLAEAATTGGALAVVGHLPFLDRLASLLVVGDETAQVIRSPNAALVRLVPKVDAAGYSIAWILPPDES